MTSLDQGRRGWWLSHAAAATTTLLIWLPLFWPGYVLSYDMVFVPWQPLTWELIAPSTGLPRAVPLDAAISTLSLAVPGWLLQRIALIGLVYAAALGAARLVPAARPLVQTVADRPAHKSGSQDDSRLTQVVAAVAYAWTPFLAERLLLGQWALLLAYAALPWLVRAAIGVRAGRPGSLPRLIIPAAAAALTPTGGLIAFAATAVLTCGRGAGRRAAAACGAVAALNLPWIVAAVTTTASGRSDPAGVAAFAARAENWSGVIGALAGTGGAWNAQTTPGSRASALVPFLTLILLALAAYGLSPLLSRWGSDARRLLGLAAGGLTLAALGAVPGLDALLRWAVAEVPGAGLLRDGQKFLIPYALALAVCAALGVERAAARMATPRARLVLVAGALLPVAVMPDLAMGAAGQLWPVRYPTDWDRVAAIVDGSPGPVVSLPFSEYRAYPWNNGRTVIDPAPRYLAAPVLIDDTLFVGSLRVAGENPRAAQVRDRLSAGLPVASPDLRWVLVQKDGRGAVPVGALAGLELAYAGSSLDLYANPGWANDPGPSDGRTALVLGSLVLAGGVLIVAIWSLRRRATRW